MVTPPRLELAFSEHPADDEFLRTGLFVQPLVPVGLTTRKENGDLAKALVAYDSERRHGEPDAVQPLLGFLAEHPGSAWTSALRVDLGAIYRRTGHFSKALETWQAAWDGSRGFTDTNGRAVSDQSVAYLSQFEAYLGRKEALEPLLNEAKTRPIRGSAAELVSESSRGLAEMLTRPEAAFKCGPSALARILATEAPSPSSAQSLKVLQRSQSTPNGLSLTAVQAISVEAGMNYQMAFRSAGAPVLVPAVAHWKVGHYAALLGKDASGHYRVGDPTFGEDISVSQSTLDEEASGYFLVGPGKLPDGWRSVDATEGDAVWGRGDTGSNHDNGATGADERHAFPCGGAGGCTTWNVEAMVVGLSLHDDPLGYTPPVGPPVRFPMDYSHRDMQQPMLFTYTNFGNKWTTGWLSYVTAHAGCDGFYGSEVQAIVIPGGTLIGASPNPDCALVYRRGGGSEPYVFPTTGAQQTSGSSISEQSALGQFSQAVLTQFKDAVSLATTGFWRTLPDGSVEKFELPVGEQFFMTEVDDPQGNAVTITYDTQMRIVGLTDALGQVTTLCYNDSWQTSPSTCAQPAASGNPPSNLQVTQVRDPFGRSAYFGYSDGEGHLTSITDVLGITSQFTYQTGTDFVATLTTPYGTTQFAFTDSTTDDTAGSTRSVTITDPLDRVSRVEFHQGGDECFPYTVDDAESADSNNISCVESLTPAGMNTVNEYLQFRNTFTWRPWQLTNPVDYNNASIIHWLHTNDTDTNSLTASRIPESTKEPLEHRVWFNYANQSTNAFGELGAAQLAAVGVGSTNQPTAIGRALDDGGTQVWTYAYNPYGKVTQSTDPVGRQLTMTYDTNGLDLLTVTNTTPTSAGSPGHDDLLLTLSDYNGQHEPQQVIGTNGQASSISYNALGQRTSSTDPLGDRWNYFYLPAAGGYLSQVVPPTPQLTRYALVYDFFGRPYQITDPQGETLTYSYDAADRLTTTLFPDGTSQVRGYTLLDMTSVIDRLGIETQRFYDADRNLYLIAELGGRQTQLMYDSGGRLDAIQDPLGLVTTFQRDLENRVTSVANGVAGVLTNDSVLSNAYDYDGAGRLEIAAQMLPSSLGYDEVVYSYNADNTVSEVQPGTALPTFFNYDPAYRRLISWYQAPSNPAATEEPVNFTSGETFAYNPVTSPPTLGANQLNQDFTILTDSTQPPGSLVTGAIAGSQLTYDALDRVVSRTLTPAAPHDVETTPETVTESWQYDGLGRVTLDSNALDQFAYTYAAGATPRVQTRVSAAGPQLVATYYNGQSDNLMQQVDYSAPSGAPIAEYAYQYDANHNVTSFTELSGPKSTGGVGYEQRYEYDRYNQLQYMSLEPLGAHIINGGAFFSYDSNGNLKYNSVFTDSSLSTGVVYGNANEATVVTTSTQAWSTPPSTIVTVPTYDVDGNLLSLGGVTYSYDDLNRLIEVTDGSNQTTFGYDGIGRLTQMVDYASGAVVANHSYVWCGSTRCAELDNTDQIPASQLNSSTMPAADKLYFSQGMTTGPEVTHFYYVSDLLGSVRQLVAGTPGSADAEVLAQYEYDPFGTQTKTLGGNGLDSDLGFAGYFYHRATGLDLAMNRVYTPTLGRWLTRDPIGNGWAFGDPERFNATDLNLYAYAGNNPQSMVDPSGNDPFGAAIGASIGGSVFGWIGGTLGAGGGLLTGPGAIVASPGGAVAGFAGGAAFGVLVGGAIGNAIGNWLGAITGIPDTRPPMTGNPGDTVVGSKQSRRYGPDGLPETDVDTGHDHGQGDPHVHDWGRNPDGTCDGQPGPVAGAGRSACTPRLRQPQPVHDAEPLSESKSRGGTVDTSKHTVGLVVDRDFGERARPISQRMHVWLIDSPTNRAVAESIWDTLKRNAPVDPLAQGITLFQSPTQLSPEEAVAEMLDTLVEHHFRMALLEVYGARDLHLLETTLSGTGFVVSGSEPDRIVCSKEA